MKNKFVMMFLCIWILLPATAEAAWIIDIFNKLCELYGVNLDIQNSQHAQLDEMQLIKKINQSQLDQMTKLSNGMMGTRQYGGQYYDANRFNWGQGSDNWQSILALVNTGGSGDGLGAIVRTLSNQFPMQDSLGSRNNIENEYYRMQAQTTLASRASAELTFNQLNHEAETLKSLHQLIDNTNDAKSSLDLNNRLVAESAMINIQQTKLLAVLVQQTAIDSQQKANIAKENAEFFDFR